MVSGVLFLKASGPSVERARIVYREEERKEDLAQARSASQHLSKR